MHKGDLVKLNPETCFTHDQGGGLRFPRGNYHEDENGYVTGYRPVTAAEVEEWRNSPASKGLNCAGESKLPPRCVAVKVHRDEVMVVERARCRVSLGWGNPEGGMTKLMKPDGKEVYLKRELVTAAA